MIIKKERRSPTNPFGLTYDIIEIIEAINDETPPLKLSKIAKKIGVTEDYVRRRIRRLDKLGLGFRADFDLRKIGLSTISVIFKEPIELDPITRVRGLDENLSYIIRWHGNINFPKPAGIILFYVPYNIEVKDKIIEILKEHDLPEISEVFEVDSVIYESLKFRSEIISLESEKIWRKITEEIINENFRNEEKNGKNLINLSNWQKHIDLIDIIILAKLQNDALTSLTEIAKLLKVNVSKVNRHFQTHIIGQNIIEGISLKKKRISLYDPENIFLIVKGRADDASFLEKTSKKLSELWEFISVIYNSKTGDYLGILMVKSYNLEKIDKYVHKIFGEILGNEYSVGILNKSSIRSYTIPFISFDRNERQWDLDQQLMDLMREKLLDILKY